MFQVDSRIHSSIWGMIIVVVSAAWVAYSVLGGAGNPQVFLTVVMVLSIVLVGGTAALLRKRKADQPVGR